MKTTRYFELTRGRPDRVGIQDAWIEGVMRNPEYQTRQADGRIRLWARIGEASNRYLRVVLLRDGETVHIETEQQLREIYGFPKGRARDKQLAALEKHSRRFIGLSPFVVVSSYSESGAVDCSPRGGRPGFVRVINDGCLLIPDAKGNNRLDSLVNIVQTANVGCLFLIPGVDETLRINGTARLSTAPEHLDLFAAGRNPPRTCIELTISEVFLHCAKALMRSELWSGKSRIERTSLPSMGTMLNEQLSLEDVPESQDEMIRRYMDDL